MNKLQLSQKLLIAGVMTMIAVPKAAHAATEAQKQAAIDAALFWLAGQQQDDGRWFSGAGNTGDVAATGASLLSYLEEGNTPTMGTYSTQVTNGLNFIFDNAAYVPISDQPAGNPDGGGMVGQGLRLGGNDPNQIYSTGLTLPSLVLAGLDVGLDTKITRASSAVDGQTYRDVIQDAVDYLSWAQNENSVWRGGWRYTPNFSSSDNSVSQWPALALIYAASAGIETPQFVKDEQKFWIDYSQNDTNGGAGYTSSLGTTPLRTGSLMVQMTAAGLDTGSSQVQNALDYIDNNWQTDCPNANAVCAFGDYYAMWAVYKGLESTIGIDDTTFITNLYPQGDAELDPGDTWNWWENFSEYLVNKQNDNGSWSGGARGSIPLQTAWAVNILQAVEIPDNGNGDNGNGDKVSVPEPSSTLSFLALGTLGVASILKRKQKSSPENKLEKISENY